MLTRRAFLSGAAIGAGMLTLERVLARRGGARAGTYPDHLVTIVIPFPPGGNSAVIGRIVADRLSSSFGQPVIIDHRPGGAGGTVGAKSVAAAEADGHTLLLSTPTALVVAPAVYRNLGYDPAKSFAPIATLFSSPQLLLVNPNVPATSLQEFITYAKANPRKINFASPGYGTQPHLLGEMLRLATGIDIVHVPYKGPAQAVTDLLAGQVQMYFETLALMLPHIEAGRVRALAVTDKDRVAQLPAVPTTTECGVPKLQATFWNGIVAPSGTPAAIIGKLNAAINDVLKTPEVRASLMKFGATPKIGSPQDFADFIAAERQKWTEVATAAGIRVD
jgi:tripartite-type tricarboxylate transporter receptor subunit TctC